MLVARRLMALTRQAHQDKNSKAIGPGVSPVPIAFTIIEAGHAPENCTGAVRRFAPDLVVLVDAAEMGEAPGTIRWLDWQETTGLSASTHTLPPYMLAQYLVGSLACRVALLGIQPAQNDIGTPLSPPVAAAVEEVSAILEELLTHPACDS